MEERQPLRVSQEELRNRREKVCAALQAANLTGAYLTSPISIFYLTGFHMVSTERPAGLVVPLWGDYGFVGPKLEETHVARYGGPISLVKTYFDYPGDTHPMEAIASFLGEMGMGKGRIGTDNPAGYMRMLGYEGPLLSELLPRVEFIEFGSTLTKMRKVKSSEEISLIRTSCRFADRALAFLIDETDAGVWDVEASLAATLRASREMKAALGEGYRQSVHGNAPCAAGYRGQVGAGSAIPHTFSTHERISRGDVLGSGASAEVGGYHCELERTLFMGPPPPPLEAHFQVMLRAQQAAIDALVPGRPASEADEAAYRVIEEAGLAEHTLHHTGHGLGLEFHEAPFLDRGEEEILAPGMVFAVEPGLYFPEIGGFRHSDSVLITEEGPEPLTRFPRDIAACTISPKKKRAAAAKVTTRKAGPKKPRKSKNVPKKKKAAKKKTAPKKAAKKKAKPRKAGRKGRK
ncbi:MAG: M24 family metallopeptidase [Planctomycetota bacterium]|jgi:Xaa-Pro aminopeptidase